MPHQSGDSLASAPEPQHVPPHPGASSSQVSLRMSRAKRKDTAPEVALRRLLHARGLRYRVAWPVPGQRRRTIDIAFTRARVAVFVDGCFWHGCPDHGTEPSANSEWWASKLAANRTRDLDTNAVLDAAGWAVIRVWEHESPREAADRVAATVAERSHEPSARSSRAQVERDRAARRS
ncbi:very short patch repair endonuclease [Isoptericola haloaureus]|uniref:very short patch repair endonuclease n=1 Tax=Isoptericola haloaureus TaxID=1542902 RepID=UPI0038602CBC